jgi:hypothetical protein
LLSIDTGTIVRLSSDTKWNFGKACSVEQVWAIQKENEVQPMHLNGVYETGPVREAQEVDCNTRLTSGLCETSWCWKVKMVAKNSVWVSELVTIWDQR